jgi:2-polyprenyl-3-methyl-5-hydroxy-6-metoxy-1,4-benzoquinol methylase
MRGLSAYNAAMQNPTEPDARRRFHELSEYRTIPGGPKKLDYLFDLVRRLQAGKETLNVLDVGCGNGPLTFPVASLGCRVVGVDVNEASIAAARQAGRTANASFEVIPGSEFDLGRQFDLIVCSEVLEHLDAPQPLVDTMARHLAADGVLMITVPNGYGPREVLGRIEIFLRRRLGLGRVIESLRRLFGMVDAATKCAVHTSNPYQDHVQKYTIRQLKRLFSRAGLRLEEVRNNIFILGVVFGKSRAVDRFDCRLADLLPKFAARGWYLLCRRGE